MEDEARFDLWVEATDWWTERIVDTGYLKMGPWFYLWRIEDEIFLRWDATGDIDGIPVWSPPRSGQIAMTSAEFETAIYGFGEALIAAMDRRVSLIARREWAPKDCTIDIPVLVAEQRERAAYVGEMRDKASTRHRTDWPRVRRMLDLLCREVQDGEDA